MQVYRGILASRCTSRPCSSVCTRRSFPQLHRIVVRAAAVEVEADADPVVEFEGDDYPDVTPTSQQVQGLLRTLVSETGIAELHLKMGTFELKVKRSTVAPSPPPPPPAAAAPVLLPRVDLTPLSLGSTDAAPLETVDESLIYVTSPKVGILRRGRYAAGKRVGKGNVVNKGDQVRRGQVLAFVEQLGTYVPIEAPQAGELFNFEVEDGGAVEYGQLVVQLAPFFGGHIIGDKKHA